MTIIEKIIAYLFKEEYVRDFVDKNHIKFITDPTMKKFIKTITKFYKDYDKIPNIDEYERYINKVAEYPQFTIMFQKLRKHEPAENYNFLIDQIRSQYVKDNFSKVLEGVDYQNVNIHDIHGKIGKIISELDTEGEIREGFIWETVEARYRKVEEGGYQYGIQTGFQSFDEITGGLNKKELYLFFGRSGIGKTRVLFNLAYNLAQRNHYGIYFSLEMYKEQMERIFDSRFGEVDSNEIKYARIDKAFYRKILDRIKETKYPLYLIEPSKKITVEYIRQKVREFKKKYPLEFIVVDYLNLMVSGKGLQRDEEYGEISKALKDLAKSEDIIVITAVQANRKTQEAENVGLEHISDSDKIAHNCDFVAYIKRGKLIDKIMDIIILKNREGKNNVTMKFLVDFAKNLIKDTVGIQMSSDKKENKDAHSKEDVRDIPKARPEDKV